MTSRGWIRGTVTLILAVSIAISSALRVDAARLLGDIWYPDVGLVLDTGIGSAQAISSSELVVTGTMPIKVGVFLNVNDVVGDGHHVMTMTFKNNAGLVAESCGWGGDMLFWYLTNKQGEASLLVHAWDVGVSFFCSYDILTPGVYVFSPSITLGEVVYQGEVLTAIIQGERIFLPAVRR